jgi:ATP-binding cassette subfamily B protein
MADQILVVQGGEVLERGSHEDLMTLNGHYAHLFSLQARGYR